MNRKLRIALTTALAAVFAVSMFVFARELLQYRAGRETYEEAGELAGVPDFSGDSAAAGSAEPAAPAVSSGVQTVYADPYAQQLREMDFSALQKVNRDVLGWIVIPGTVISYPMLQTSNNTYYLRHTWKKQSSVVGAIFLEHQNSGDFSDFNTVIYGHNMNNGSMFGSLKKYKKKSWWAAHPIVYLTDGNGTRAYRIFAAYEVATAGETYQIGFPSDQAKQQFLDYCVSQSVIKTGVTPTVSDHVVTLSTCTGRGHATRWVVQAVLKNPNPPKTQTPAQTEPAAPEQAESPASGSAEPENPAASGSAAASQDGSETGTSSQNGGTPEEAAPSDEGGA
ncbi:MAG: class B sortase [Oscillibacter sp.]|nr:class B sortase [Oscillibacter sp.]